MCAGSIAMTGLFAHWLKARRPSSAHPVEAQQHASSLNLVQKIPEDATLSAEPFNEQRLSYAASSSACHVD